jgi:hypothetical protein
MEPADDRREHAPFEPVVVALAAPQWSPPVTGRNTLAAAITP